MPIVDSLIPIRRFHQMGKHAIPLNDFQKEAVRHFNYRIRRNKISFEEVPCLCGNDRFSLVASIDRYGLIQSTVLCKKCGLMQSVPRMTPAQYRFFYESDEYRRLYNAERFADNFESCYTDGRGEAVYRTITAHKNAREIKTVLEFGAGGGWNLLPFLRQGIAVRGYDLSKELIRIGTQKGIDLRRGDIDDIEGQYDVIIANHVVEHFTDLLSDIRKLKSHLNVNGVMYIAVPDIRNFSMQQIQNAHTYYFTAETLEYYMGRCGLRMTHHQPEFGGHMSGIFIVGKPEIDDDFLEGHYEYIAKMLKRYGQFYYPRRLLVAALNSLGLKNRTKCVLRRFIN